MEKENGRVTEAERQGILFRGSFQWNIHQSHQYTSAENRRDNAVDNGKEMAKRHPRKLFAEEKRGDCPYEPSESGQRIRYVGIFSDSNE